MEWGSDTDLVSSLGIRCSPALHDRRQSDMQARLAPMALPTAEQANRITPAPAGVSSKDWSSRQRQRFGSADSMDMDIEKLHEPMNNFHPDVPTTPRGGMSFFDVGGLLIHNDSSHSPRSLTDRTFHQPPLVGEPSSSSSSPPHRQQQPNSHPRKFSSPSPMPSPQMVSYQTSPLTPSTSNQGSHALLQDIGGLLEDNQHKHNPPEQYPHNDSPLLVDNDKPPPSPPKDTTRAGRRQQQQQPRHLSLTDVLREEEEEMEEGGPSSNETDPISPTSPTSTNALLPRALRYEPLQQGKRAHRDLQDVGGLLR